LPSIKEALSIARSHIGDMAENPLNEAYILLSHLLKKDRVYLFLHEDEELENFKEYEELFLRREEGEPIEYITKSVSFYSEEFFIDKGALIPRPETEILVDKVLEIVKRSDKEFLTIAEIGIGSGAISVMLAKLLDNVKIFATDISSSAIEIAKENINRFGVGDKIEVRKCSYLDKVDEDIDIIVSNPPYVADDFKVKRPLEYEPKEAIFGGVNGHEVLENIIDISAKRDIKYLVCEMGYDQKESVSALLKKSGFEDFDFYQDLSGLDRGFVAKRG